MLQPVTTRTKLELGGTRKPDYRRRVAVGLDTGLDRFPVPDGLAVPERDHQCGRDDGLSDIRIRSRYENTAHCQLREISTLLPHHTGELVHEPLDDLFS